MTYVYETMRQMGAKQYDIYTKTSTDKCFKSHGHSQADVGMRRQHIDVVLTQWVDDDRFAPVNQVSSNLKDLCGKNGSQRT